MAIIGLQFLHVISSFSELPFPPYQYNFLPISHLLLDAQVPKVHIASVSKMQLLFSTFVFSPLNGFVRVANCQHRQLLSATHSAAYNPKMRFIDIAANLTDNVFKGSYNGTNRHPPDLSSVLSRASSTGVVRMLVTAGTLSQSVEAAELCRDRPMLFSTVGVHPTRAGEMVADPEAHCKQLLQVITNFSQNVVAVGECGLDYDRTQFCSQEDQLPAFIAQFSIAEATGLPMFLHDRNTKGDFGRVVRENRSRFSTGVVHSFTGTMEEMQNYVDLDLYIGINGCSLKTLENLQVAAAVPLPRIMLETDSPYCQIRPAHAGSTLIKTTWPAKDKKKFSPDAVVKSRCEPCMIRQVCEVLASVKGISEEELAHAAFNNTMKVFFPNEVRDMGSSPHDLCSGAIPTATEL